MTYARIVDGVPSYPYSIAQLRADLPQTSFPAEMSEAQLAEFGVVTVAPTAQPTSDPITETVLEVAPELVDGAWRQAWEVVAADSAEIERRKLAIRAAIVLAVQARLDAFASERGYGDAQTSPIVSACSYATSTHAKYGPEGRRCVELREQTWDALFDIEAEVIAETRPMPTSYDDIAGELPALTWGT